MDSGVYAFMRMLIAGISWRGDVMQARDAIGQPTTLVICAVSRWHMCDNKYKTNNSYCETTHFVLLQYMRTTHQIKYKTAQTCIKLVRHAGRCRLLPAVVHTCSLHVGLPHVAYRLYNGTWRYQVRTGREAVGESMLLQGFEYAANKYIKYIALKISVLVCFW